MIALLVISVMMSLIIIWQANNTDEQSVKAERLRVKRQTLTKR